MGISQLVTTLKPSNITTHHPGKVGSVGEVDVRPRFRQSRAEMPWAVDPYWVGKRSHKLGSNIQDGHTLGYSNKGGPASQSLKSWNGNRSFKHQYGWTFHNIQPENGIRMEPVLSLLEKYSWKRKVARTKYIKSGSLFMPQGYTSKNTPRGGLYPLSTSAGGTTPAPVPFDPTTGNNVVLPATGPNPDNELAAGPSRLGVQNIGGRRVANTGIQRFAELRI